MFPGRHGIRLRSAWWPTVLVGLLLSVTRPPLLRGQDPLSGGELLRGSRSVDLAELNFVTHEFRADEAREGHVTLSWSEVDGAADYELSDADGSRFYRGVLPQAFVSGLANGMYRFHALARDATGAEIASTRIPATVIVEHWLLRDALALFLCGLCVFVSLVFVIVRGARAQSGRIGERADANSRRDAGSGEPAGTAQ